MVAGDIPKSPALAAEAQRMVELLAETAAYRARLKGGTERDLQ